MKKVGTLSHINLSLCPWGTCTPQGCGGMVTLEGETPRRHADIRGFVKGLAFPGIPMFNPLYLTCCLSLRESATSYCQEKQRGFLFVFLGVANIIMNLQVVKDLREHLVQLG